MVAADKPVHSVLHTIVSLILLWCTHRHDSGLWTLIDSRIASQIVLPYLSLSREYRGSFFSAISACAFLNTPGGRPASPVSPTSVSVRVLRFLRGLATQENAVCGSDPFPSRPPCCTLAGRFLSSLPVFLGRRQMRPASLLPYVTALQLSSLWLRDSKLWELGVAARSRRAAFSSNLN